MTKKLNNDNYPILISFAFGLDLQSSVNDLLLLVHSIVSIRNSGWIITSVTCIAVAIVIGLLVVGIRQVVLVIFKPYFIEVFWYGYLFKAKSCQVNLITASLRFHLLLKFSCLNPGIQELMGVKRLSNYT